jgi:hypothetical protein
MQTNDDSGFLVQYILVNIGCLVCGVPSKIVGIFENPTDAEGLAKHLSQNAKWRNEGLNDYKVFSVRQGFWVDPDYIDLI